MITLLLWDAGLPLAAYYGLRLVLLVSAGRNPLVAVRAGSKAEKRAVIGLLSGWTAWYAGRVQSHHTARPTIAMCS